jgi:hypothetical protein
MNIQSKIAVTAFALLASGHSLAAVTWTLAGGAAGNAFAGSTWNIAASNISGTSAGGTANLGVTAYANTQGADNSIAADSQGVQLQTRTSNINGSGLTSGIQDYGSSGLGIINLDTCGSVANCDANEGANGEHAMDNHQRYEMALLSFGRATSLSSVQVGWNASDNCGSVGASSCSSAMHDSDMTVLAYTGGGNPLTSLSSNLTWTQLLSNGWSLIGNYSNVGSEANNSTSLMASAANRTGGSGSDGIYSSYWLVGAYNPLANPGGAGPFALNNSTSDGQYVDGMKLLKVVGETAPGTGVPEPGPLALLGLAAVGMVATRRRLRS